MGDGAPQPSEEEKARLAKLLAETELAAAEKELLAAQLQKAERENFAAENAAKSLQARYWFIPTAAHVFQWIGANSICSPIGTARRSLRLCLFSRSSFIVSPFSLARVQLASLRALTVLNFLAR